MEKDEKEEQYTQEQKDWYIKKEREFFDEAEEISELSQKFAIKWKKTIGEIRISCVGGYNSVGYTLHGEELMKLHLNNE